MATLISDGVELLKKIKWLDKSLKNAEKKKTRRLF